MCEPEGVDGLGVGHWWAWGAGWVRVEEGLGCGQVVGLESSPTLCPSLDGGNNGDREFFYLALNVYSPLHCFSKSHPIRIRSLLNFLKLRPWKLEIGRFRV